MLVPVLMLSKTEPLHLIACTYNSGRSSTPPPPSPPHFFGNSAFSVHCRNYRRRISLLRRGSFSGRKGDKRALSFHFSPGSARLLFTSPQAPRAYFSPLLFLSPFSSPYENKRLLSWRESQDSTFIVKPSKAPPPPPHPH